MTMHINLSKEMEAFIKSKVESGFYGNATEVIRDAIRRMQEDDARIAAFRAAVDKGETDIEAGRLHPYTDTAMDEIVAEVLGELDPKKRKSSRG
ncbi:MAG: type II toxin-antitoxin system ParD family antitoxin [Asticcacaulis sp.]|nr:type II toxin-antitoxin system ParD family antitoxin [Asticcacaulis sp.]